MVTSVLENNGMFPETLVTDLVNKVKGTSALSQLSASRPVPFNGLKQFTFNMDKEIDVVAENGKKSEGGISFEPITMQPIKVEYGARLSDEFVYAAEEEQINFLQAFNDGFARKLAKGLDLMAILGINPRTGRVSDVIGNNSFIKQVDTVLPSTLEDGNIDDAIGAAINQVIKDDEMVTGLIMNQATAYDLSQVTTDVEGKGAKKYPQLAWGANPGVLNGLPLQITNNISYGNSENVALLGDFASGFSWGYAKQIPLEIIQYGDPDNSGFDLKGYNQVYVRAEAYLGWGILNPGAFAFLQNQGTSGDE